MVPELHKFLRVCYQLLIVHMFQKKKLDNSALQQEKGWATEGGMLKLYWYSAVLIVNSAINGYDGSMMNVRSHFDTNIS
jgi:hypothetical protein